MFPGSSSEMTRKDTKKIEDEIKEVREFVDFVNRLGGEMPQLVSALDKLEKAIAAGRAIAEAAEEASKQLKAHVTNLKETCKTVDKEMEWVCKAQVERKWQARAVKWTLSPENEESVISKAIDKAIKKLTPEFICKHWDRCANIK